MPTSVQTMMKNWLLRVIPDSAKPFVQRAFYFPIDTVDMMLGRRDPLTPPRGLNYTGYGDFKKGGEEFLGYFVKLCNLQADEKVLDVGCGIGRIAVALTRHLNQDGKYEGFDINPVGIKWCSNMITPRYSNFNFRLVDIRNRRYNPHGKFDAASFKFPYDDETFDFIFATSVFTHMLSSETENYLHEISRVMKKQGRCLLTFFLRHSDGLSNAENSRGPALDFKYSIADSYVYDRKLPEIAVAYDESVIRGFCARNSLKVVEPVYYGAWSGRHDFLSYQDMILATKVEHPGN